MLHTLTLLLVFGALFAAWAYLFGMGVALGPMPRLRRYAFVDILTAIQYAVIVLPLCWIVGVVVLYVRVRWMLGSWPRPDHIAADSIPHVVPSTFRPAELGFPYLATVVLFLGAFATLLVFPPLWSLASGLGRKLQGKTLALFASAWALVWLCFAWDPGGSVAWWLND